MRRTMGLVPKIFGGFLGALMVLAAAPGARADDKTLRIGTGGAFTSMDPHYHNLNPNNVLTLYVFEPLTDFDRQFVPRPSLAASWKPINDTTWEFVLRPNVRFHDGTPFTAADVAATFKRVPTVLNSPSSFNFAVKPVTQMEIVDDHTVRMHSATPQPLLPYSLTQLKIISAKNADAQTADYNSGKAAIGTGPYRLASFLNGDRAQFVRNEDWWGPKLAWDKVDYRLIANGASRIAALQSGDVDVIDQVPPRDTVDLNRNAKLTVVAVAGQRLIYIQPDISRAQTPFAFDLDGKQLAANPFRDVRVLRALSLAINREGIRDRIMDGFSAPTGQIMPKGLSGFSPSIPVDPYDPAAAKKLLEDAGFPHGFALTLHGPNNRYINDGPILEAIAQMWARIGVKTTVEAMPAAIYFSRAQKFEFSIRLTGWSSDTGEASSNILTLLASSNPDKGRGAIFNPTTYANPKVDELAEKSASTIDPEEREALYRRVEELAMPDYPIIPLHHQVNIWAIRKGLRFDPGALEGTRAWWVEAAP